jgi:hypothetical protein
MQRSCADVNSPPINESAELTQGAFKLIHYSEISTYDNLEVEEDLPRHLLVLLQGGEYGEGETEEDHQEDTAVIQECQLPAGPFQKVVSLCLGIKETLHKYRARP